MKVLLIQTSIPFLYGGAEVLASSLRQQLIQRGHDVRVLRLPLDNYSLERIQSSITACMLTSVDCCNFDRIISFKFPTYCIPSSNHTIWLLHQFREMYDLWGTTASFPDSIIAQFTRDWVQRIDKQFLTPAKIFTISNLIDQRLFQSIGRHADGVLYPPIEDADRFYSASSKKYFFYPGRISNIKRQWLAVEAMQYVNPGYELWIAGKPDNPQALQKLQGTIDKYQLNDRVRLLGFISQEEKYQYYAESLAILNFPFEEDYGYVTLEAFHSKKACVSCTDSGGPREFIQDRQNGFLVEPSPKAIADCLNLLIDHPNLAAQYGSNGYQLLVQRYINWENVITKLLES